MGVYSDTTQLTQLNSVQPSQSCFCLWRHDLQTESTGSLRSLIGDSCSRCERVDNSTSSWVELSCVAIDTSPTQLNWTSSWVELCRYKHPFICQCGLLLQLTKFGANRTKFDRATAFPVFWHGSHRHVGFLRWLKLAHSGLLVASCLISAPNLVQIFLTVVEIDALLFPTFVWWRHANWLPASIFVNFVTIPYGRDASAH